MASTRLRWNDAEVRRLYERAGREATRRAARIVLAEAESTCPVDTGELRDSLHIREGRDGEGPYFDVVADADHALVVELGSRPHIIRSHGDYPLRDEHGNVFGQEVHHPGTAPQPYLRPALHKLFGRVL